MAKMSIKEALAAALDKLKKMSPDELRQELDANRNGDIATTLREVRAYLVEHCAVFHYALPHIDTLLAYPTDFESTRLSLRELMNWTTADNDERYALAA